MAEVMTQITKREVLLCHTQVCPSNVTTVKSNSHGIMSNSLISDRNNCIIALISRITLVFRLMYIVCHKEHANTLCSYFNPCMHIFVLSFCSYMYMCRLQHQLLEVVECFNKETKEVCS